MNIKSKNNWYAVYVRSRHERKVEKLLTEIGIESYVPIRKVLKQWSDRKKWVEEILISGYVFVNVDLKRRDLVYNTDGIVSFVKIAGEYITIPDNQISLLKLSLEDSKNCVEVTHLDLRLKQKYEVVEGEFAGKIVIIEEVRGNDRVYGILENVNLAFSIEVNVNNLREIK